MSQEPISAASRCAFDTPGYSAFLDPAVQGCPHDFYRHLHRSRPVFWDDVLGMYVVTTADLIRKAALDTETFSSVGSLDYGRTASVNPEAERIRARSLTTQPLTVVTDPPLHRAYRRIMNNALTARRVAATKPFVEERAARLIDQMLAKGGGDFMEEYAIPLPFAVVSTMMGLEETMFSKMRQWADSYSEWLMGAPTAERAVECAHLSVEYHDFFARLIAERRADPSPSDDLVTAVALGRFEDGQQMSMVEALSMVEQFVVAGAETTITALGMGMLALASQPALLRQIRSDPDKIPTFVEEVLRLYAPAQGLFRVALKETKLGGLTIAKGARVMLRWGAGNIDEAVYEDPAVINLDRANPRNHLTFGYGIHHCQGAPLARVELQATFRLIAERVGYLSIDDSLGGIDRRPLMAFLGLRHLGVRMSTAA